MIGLSYDEAAQAANLRIDTIRSRVHRAHQHLVAAMEHIQPDSYAA